MPRICPPAVTLQLSRQSSGWEMKWKRPCQQLVKPMSASFTVHVDQTLVVALFVATATSTLISNYQSVSEPHVQHLGPCPCGFPFHPPDHFRVTGKLREAHSESISNYIQKDWFSWRTFTPNDQCLMNFPSSICKFFFLLWKVIQKYGYIQEVGEDVLLESFLSVLGISFQWLCQSRSNPPVVIVLPSPKWYLTAWMNKSA